jgi:DNA-binding response OmpR family regulator
MELTDNSIGLINLACTKERRDRKAMTSRVGTGQQRVGPLNMLVVEDDPFLAEAIARLFCRRGYAVRVTFSAAQAHLEAEAQPFDCAIVDVVLGDDDGISLASHLLSASRIRGAVFYSGVLQGETRRRAANLGVLVDKAARFEELAQAVEEATSSGASADTAKKAEES